MSFNKILVATDFSNCSKKALGTAISICENKRSHIYLIHTIDLIHNYEVSEAEAAVKEADIALMADEVNQLIEEMKLDGYRRIAEDRIHVLEEHGSYKDIILKKADEFEIDLIIMATHGPDSFSKKLVGTTPEYIVKHAKCSVLTIKPDGYPIYRD